MPSLFVNIADIHRRAHHVCLSERERERMCLVYVSQHHSECMLRHVCVCACGCVGTYPSLRAQPAVLSVGVWGS